MKGRPGKWGMDGMAGNVVPTMSFAQGAKKASFFIPLGQPDRSAVWAVTGKLKSPGSRE